MQGPFNKNCLNGKNYENWKICLVFSRRQRVLIIEEKAYGIHLHFIR